MLTTDLALREDPAYEKISRRFHEDNDAFRLAFAKAWYKLLHRDMGPVTRYLGPWVPEAQLWQDPVPAVDHELVGDADIAALKAKLLDSGLSVAQLVTTAWASAATFRQTDKRGGANGARIRLEPQRGWEVNAGARRVLPVLERVQQEFNDGQAGGKRVSLADLIVLGGAAAVEKAARDAGHEVTVPFTPGRTDASQEDTDVESFGMLEPRADGFRNYLRAGEKLLARDAAGGPGVHARSRRARDGRARRRPAGARRERRRLVDRRPHRPPGRSPRTSSSTCSPRHGVEGVGVEGERLRDPRRRSGEVRWTATAVDLVFGSNSQLRAIAEVYASADAGEKFVHDFVAAWTKVMEHDRFDLIRRRLSRSSGPLGGNR